MTNWDDIDEWYERCRHANDARDCGEPCNCEHACHKHRDDHGNPSHCREPGCGCVEYEHPLCVRCLTEHMLPSSAKEHEDLCPACWIACSRAGAT